jgi:hypothetical protein
MVASVDVVAVMGHERSGEPAPASTPNPTRLSIPPCGRRRYGDGANPASEREDDDMSKYLILIFQDEAAAQPSGDSVSANYRAFMEKHAGSLRGGVALENPATATSIRRDETGESVVTDGPFAESKEALGGTFLIEAADLDEALAIAKEVPAGIGVEVRPVRVVT